MRKFFSFAMMSAVALTGAMLFTACASEDAQAPVNPTFDGEAVKASFTISVGSVAPTTRMTADASQSDEQFNGMQDIYLFPAKATIESSTAFTEGYLNLPNFDGFDTNLTGANGKKYSNVTFSLGISDFLFYAATADAHKGNGELEASYLTTPLTTASTPAAIHFNLVPYQDGKGLSDVRTAGASTLEPLTAVYSELGTQAGEATTAGKTDVAAKFRQIQQKLRNPNPYNADPAAETEWYFYAGSSTSMEYLMSDVYNTLINVNTGDFTTYVSEIIDVLDNYFTLTGTGTAADPYKAEWTSDPDFPGSMNLPDGAVAIKWDGSKFDYFQANLDGVIASEIGQYTHPAKIYYTVNTKGMVSDATHLSDYTTTDTWEMINNTDLTNPKNHYSEEAVKATTQSVIMKNQVQYAVGRFDAKVRVKPSVIIKDNGSGIDGAADKDPQPVTVPAAGYKLTGILVGGQNQVGWDFAPSADGTQVIYDNVVKDEHNADIYAIQQTTYSNANSTLVLQTVATSPVKVALEFVNNGNAFYGINHNIIPAGSKFYLIANLNPEDATGVANNVTGSRVFMQDYTTTAQLTISETSLAKAYNVIPDLRSPKLEFGLSVNLQWQNGITFEKEFGAY